MRRILIVLCIGVVATGILYSYHSWIEKERLANGMKFQVERESLRKQFFDLAKHWDAAPEWKMELSGNKGKRDDPVMTIELERVWLEKPILFVGRLDDVLSLDSENYLVKFRQSPSDSPIFQGEEFQLALACPMKTVEAFLADRRRGQGLSLGDAAVIAKIDRIERIDRQTSGEDSGIVFVGRGRCLDLVFNDKADLWFELP